MYFHMISPPHFIIVSPLPSLSPSLPLSLSLTLSLSHSLTLSPSLYLLAEDFNIIQQEIAILADCKHPNIVGYNGSYLR